MIVIPAIDLKGGKCVRLLQGAADAEKIYSDDPVSMALSFQAAGAQRLHLVDLDGAFQGQSSNLDKIQDVVKALRIPIELGGGIRTFEDVQRMLELGITSVIVGTMAVKKPEILQRALEHFPQEQILLGIDARNRKVAVEGWVEGTELDDVEFGKKWKALGIQRVIYTDISRDGMLTGPNFEALREFAQKTGLRVTASGGISSKADIDQLIALNIDSIDHVIVGKAIYEGKIQLKEVL
ncbi:1-(5-phosphoribosyl)-5-[(5-phosphoribosylamino)methylideneamino]imidazole-4-carboxamide isomerase [Deltaproteobacteria bacterium TL4]